MEARGKGNGAEDADGRARKGDTAPDFATHFDASEPFIQQQMANAVMKQMVMMQQLAPGGSMQNPAYYQPPPGPTLPLPLAQPQHTAWAGAAGPAMLGYAHPSLAAVAATLGLPPEVAHQYFLSHGVAPAAADRASSAPTAPTMTLSSAAMSHAKSMDSADRTFQGSFGRASAAGMLGSFSAKPARGATVGAVNPLLEKTAAALAVPRAAAAAPTNLVRPRKNYSRTRSIGDDDGDLPSPSRRHGGASAGLRNAGVARKRRNRPYTDALIQHAHIMAKKVGTASDGQEATPPAQTGPPPPES